MNSPNSEALTMSQRPIMVDEMKEEEGEAEGNSNDNENNDNTNTEAAKCTVDGRKERRKAAKKEKRKKKRKEMAELARREEEARLNDPEVLWRLQTEEEQERLRAERDRTEFEEREKKIVEEWERRRAQEQREEEERRKRTQEEDQSKHNLIGYEDEVDEDGWEYVEEGPPEIIWQGNEIIVKKKKIRVKKKNSDQQITKEDPSRPTSNPLPPQSEAFGNNKRASILSAQELLENVAQETPNFGTEQDKAHCPFHLKTGACRFGSRCSRVHFYPDQSCTLLIKNMYNGPGLAWEQDEGLEYTDEEMEHAYEEFYEDVHTEFLKFGEIVNFKVCRNGSPHLRGNVYVHYKSLGSAVMAYQSVNGRYFAGKQVQCEFVGVTRWKIAICGEFMKSNLKTCSRGMACNFIHCFRNPGGDYEWADWDKPPPKYWLKKMSALFGYSDESGYDKLIEKDGPRLFRNSSRTLMDDADRYHARRFQSREIYYSRNPRNYTEDDTRSSTYGQHRRFGDRKQPEVLNDGKYDDTSNSREKDHSKNMPSDSDSDENLDRDRGRDSSYDHSRIRFQERRNRKLGYRDRGGKSEGRSMHGSDNDSDNHNQHGHRSRSRRHREKRYESMGGSCGGGSEVDRLDMNRNKAVNRSSPPTEDRQKNTVSASDDHWDALCEGNLTGHWSDVEQPSVPEKSPGSRGSEEFEDKKSKRLSARKLKNPSIRDDLGRGDGDIEHDSGDSCDYDRSYKSFDSSSRYPRKDTGPLELGDSKKLFPDHPRKSKRKRYGDKKLDPESRIHYHKTSGADKRGRWEPNNDDDWAEHKQFDYHTDEATDERGRWEPDKVYPDSGAM